MWTKRGCARNHTRPGIPSPKPFGGLLGLKLMTEFLKAIGEIYIALNKDVFFASFLVQPGYCTEL